MTTNIANIALTGLRAAQAGLAVTANNISNQGTVGYSRQMVIQQSAVSNFSGAGYFGQGVDVTTVKRAYSDFLNGQASQGISRLSYLNTYADQMSGLINRLGSVDTGVNQSLNELYSAMSNFSQRVGEPAPRQLALSAAQATAARFRAVSEDLSQLSHGANSQIDAAVGQINQLVQGIAGYNEKIGNAMAAGDGHTPNELLDQRDQMVRQLGELVGISTSTQGNAVNVFMSNGQPLVVGLLGSRIEFQSDSGAVSGFSLALVTPGRNVLLNEHDIDGGQLGALAQFRDQELRTAQSELGRLAIAMASAYNQQQQFGLDASGDPAGALFTLGAPKGMANRENVGDARLAISYSDTRSLNGSDYELSRVGSDYVVTRLSDSTVVGSYSSLPQNIEGISISLLAGDLADGDSFIIDVTGQAASGLEVVLSDANKLAGAAPMGLLTPSTNAGTALATFLRSVESATTDTRQSVNVVFTSASTYELKDDAGVVLGAGALQPPKTTIAHNGWAFDLAGTPVAGDTFKVNADPGDPSGDNRNALAMSVLGSAKLIDGASLTDGYASILAQTATRAGALNVSKNAQQAATSQALAAEQSLVGVNLDEEGAMLIRFQQAYAAAGKVLGMSSQLFEQLLGAIR